jgi:hypothetical protein
MRRFALVGYEDDRSITTIALDDVKPIVEVTLVLPLAGIEYD